MIDFKSWKLLHESLGSSTLLGLSSGPKAIGVIGAQWANVDATEDVTTEAPKQPIAPEPEDMDDDDVDGDEDDDMDDDDMDDDDVDGDEDDDMDDDDMDDDDDDMMDKGGKSKCNCDCDKCEGKGSHAAHGHDKKEEANYFGNGMDTYFCNCGSKDPKDGMCSKCSKYVVSESYSREKMVDDALKFYRGTESALYSFASYLSKGYNPGKQLTEATIDEINDTLGDMQAKKSLDGFADLLNLGFKIVDLSK
jgi:hypothetical protein